MGNDYRGRSQDRKEDYMDLSVIYICRIEHFGDYSCKPLLQYNPIANETNREERAERNAEENAKQNGPNREKCFSALCRSDELFFEDILLATFVELYPNRILKPCRAGCADHDNCWRRRQ